jgi:hypothetical protein
MLAGCLALTNSLSWVSIPLSRLLALIATLNVYEIAILALAYFLIRNRGLRHDGATLLLLEAFFLADVTFLNAEISTANLRWGLIINALLLIAAAIKLAVAMRLLGMPRLAGEYGLLLITLAVNFAIPVFFARIDHGSVSPIWLYVMWWIAGILLGSFALLQRWMQFSNSRISLPLLAYLAMPWLSLTAHIGILHYVYDIPYWGACSAPLLLGLTLLLGRVAATRLVPRRDLLVLRLLLPLAALMVSANDPSALCLTLDKFAHFVITPTKLALGAAYLTYVYCFLSGIWMWMLPAGAACAAIAIFGPTVDQTETFVQNSWSNSSKFIWDKVPKTMTQWGWIGIAASFGFLGIGASISLRRRPGEPAPLPENGE